MASPDLKPLRILIVEDDALINMLLADMLEMMGHVVCATEFTKAGAVAAAARCLPDMMIVDAQLGSDSGIAAVEEILTSRFVPHVFVSGNIRGVLALKPHAAVAEKPYTEASLAAAMNTARLLT